MKTVDADKLKEDLFIKFGNQLPNGLLDEVDNAPTIPLPDFKEGYKQAILDGKTNFSRPQCDCENCDFRKFTETFVDGVVEVMNKNGITSVEQLSEILKGGADNEHFN